MDSVLVSIVSFNGKPFLQRCLDSILSQTYQQIEISILDNASEDGTVDFVSKNFPTVQLIPSNVNRGFSGGHNFIIHQTRSSFVLVLNQDAFLLPTFVQELVAAMKEHPEVGIAGGKLYSLRNINANVEESRIIDMTWLDIEKKRRQICYHQWRSDEAQTTVPTFAFAMDGAAMFLRRSMLTDIEIEGDFFDEDFFAGKEDLDISWRAQLCGWKCLHVPGAIGFHLRTFTSKDKRSEITDTLKVSSIRNRYLLMIKNDCLAHVVRHFPYIALYDMKIMAYVLLYERSSFMGYIQAMRLLPKALRKRREIMSRKRVENKYILSWFR